MAAQGKSWLGELWRPLAALLLWVLGMVPLIAAPPLLPSLVEPRVGDVTAFPVDGIPAAPLYPSDLHQLCGPPLEGVATGFSGKTASAHFGFKTIDASGSPDHNSLSASGLSRNFGKKYLGAPTRQLTGDPGYTPDVDRVMGQLNAIAVGVILAPVALEASLAAGAWATAAAGGQGVVATAAGIGAEGLVSTGMAIGADQLAPGAGEIVGAAGLFPAARQLVGWGARQSIRGVDWASRVRLTIPEGGAAYRWAGSRAVAGETGIFSAIADARFTLAKKSRGYWGDYLESKIGAPPIEMVRPHAHHILFQKGIGARQQYLVKQGQTLLRRYGVDPRYGIENLVWAPNVAGQHTLSALRNVVSRLRKIEKFGGDREEIIDELRALGIQAAQRK